MQCIFVLPRMNSSLRILDSEVFGGTQSLSRRSSGTHCLAALPPVLPWRSSPHHLQCSIPPQASILTHLPWTSSTGVGSGSCLHPVCSQTVSVVDQCIHGLFLYPYFKEALGNRRPKQGPVKYWKQVGC